ncbi:adenosylmethionine--8-amino-7-oxononanoate transaminase [Clostridium sardiniense]|uniref:adenosylmethionine--8-amino-7-oxononanoate transaminase n=1 Tax=Clostridium sardiniense TaxID=29369 RepID=UPI003D34EBEE
MNLVEKDLKYIWHPCSQMKDYETLKPIVIEKGEGVYLYDIDGNKYLDAISSWWCNLLGHSNKRINKAINDQVNKIEHVIFANFSNIPAIELSERLVKITPDRLEKLFFVDNGSAAVETALKMSFHYHQQLGKVKKKRFVAITDAYHGETLAALSMSDLDIYSKVYKPLMLDTIRVTGPDCYRCSFNKDRDTCNSECFIDMQKKIEDKHEEISAIIIEPMLQGAAGMKIYSPMYLKKLRELCDKYDINLIADEIAVGFGRTGKMFACEHADISPDIMCISKGLTAGYLPMAITMTSNKIYDVFYGDYNENKAFLHSHTYSGNALGCAVALEVLKIFEEENILEMVNKKGKLLNDLLKKELRDHPLVGEIRNIGMINGIELVRNKNTKDGFPSEMRVGYEIFKIALKKGVLLRPLGNVIYFNPPYVISEEEMIELVIKCKESIDLWEITENNDTLSYKGK